MKKKLNKMKDRVLAYGEVTGHSHAVDVDVYEDTETGLKHFEGETEIRHEEHKPVTLPEKKWVSGIVQEFDHVERQMRNVID